MKRQDIRDEVNPGELLHELLCSAVPQSAKSSMQLDDLVVADGELARIVYEGALFFVLRRLITAAHHLARVNEREGGDERALMVSLRTYVRERYRFQAGDREKVVVLLRDAIACASRCISKTAKRDATSGAERAGDLYCYVCGRESDGDSSLDHVWPKSLGGSSGAFNLRPTCKRCNESKSHWFGSSDFHYEGLALRTDAQDESFQKEFRNELRVAAFMKGGSSCAVCGGAASRDGAILLGRRDPDDSWHYLNIGVFCAKHLPPGDEPMEAW